jgi:hypothetical protein
MPVRSRSRASSSRIFLLKMRSCAFSSSSSGEKPSWMILPSLSSRGASSRIAQRSSSRSSSSAKDCIPCKSSVSLAGSAIPALHQLCQRGYVLQRLPQGEQIPWGGAPRSQAPCKALQIRNAPQKLAKLAALLRAVHEEFDGVQAPLDLRPIEQRREKPAPQQPLAHSRDRLIDHVEERRLGTGAAQLFDKLQIAHGERIKPHLRGKLIELWRTKMLQGSLLGLLHIAEEPCGAAPG